ncbi:MAG: glycosyltransferase [Acidimicrobiia bacterium]|nr:glycosyltransferase [Acidimicrobiia bacterium]MDH4306508.1 glycosyltransferase [Acidimicrobiia bacterium]
MSPHKRRVLVMIKGLGMGGAEQLIVESARFWDRQRFDYEVGYILPWKNQLVDRIEEAGIRVTCIGGARGSMGLATIRRLRDLIRRFDPHIVHAHLPSTGVMCRLFSGRPVVYTEHNLADSYRFPTGPANRLTYGRNRAVGAVSEAVASSLAGFPGPDPQVIPNGVAVDVDPEAPGRVRTELDLPADTNLVVQVGNIRPLKGHQNLIDAAAILQERRGDFAIVGIGGEKNPGDLERISDAARQAGVEDRVRFLGRRDDARSFIAAADVFVNPSDVEGLPLVVLEALALSRPVVATAVGGVPSVVIDGETGRLVPPADPRALADAIDSVLSDPERASLGLSGASLVSERFGAATMVEAYERIYEVVADG